MPARAIFRRLAARVRTTRRPCSSVGIAALALLARTAQGQHRVPAGWEEGMFDVVAAGLPQASVSVLVTPRGKFLVPLRTILDPLAVPYRVAADSGVVRVSRPAGV